MISNEIRDNTEDWPEEAQANNFRCTYKELEAVSELVAAHQGHMYPRVMKWVEEQGAPFMYATALQIEEALKWNMLNLPIQRYRDELGKRDDTTQVVLDLWMEVQPFDNARENYIDSMVAPLYIGQPEIEKINDKIIAGKYYEGVWGQPCLPRILRLDTGTRKLELEKELLICKWYYMPDGPKATRQFIVDKIKEEWDTEVTLDYVRTIHIRHKELFTTK